MPTVREWVIELVVMLAVGVALAALGPFGSFALGSFGDRLLYWIPVALIGYAIFRPITLAAMLFARRLGLSELGAAAVGVTIAAIPATFAIAYFGGYRPGAAPSFDQLFQLYVQVAVIGVLVTTVFLLIERIQQEPEPAPPASAIPTSPPPASPFFDRLPKAWGDRLVALEMEDHYVRAHGTQASALILLRMRDAEAELAGIDGLRVHRSWWVARASVDKVLRDGRGYKLRLTNGLEAPVARDRIALLKSAGWID
ncbi:MAG: LytTR family transcriptional regulator DNA-binding domain-containing protein [Pseudomonadota bacterium]|nr:LytTR family transcriptional regulator DNA-binding domain-containing protein [Pseudomonadota bacterium]